MLVIALQNPKGGVGKSTLAIHVATAAHQDGIPTHLVDTDPQQTVLDWHALTASGYAPDVSLCTSAPNLQRHVSNLTADLVVIDGAARVQDMTGAVLRIADVVLIPVQPSTLDVWGSLDLINASTRAQRTAALVMNRYTVRANITEDARDVLAQYGLPVLQGCAQRVAYPESMQQGETALTYTDPKARAEVRALTDAIGNLASHL